jgi:hypothetical protein
VLNVWWIGAAKSKIEAKRVYVVVGSAKRKQKERKVFLVWLLQ